MKFALQKLVPFCRFVLIVLLAGLTTSPLFAQEKKKTPPRRIRFLPVGDSPPFRQEVRNGVRYELEPPAGSIPPRNVRLILGEEAHTDIRLRLGNISEPAILPKDLTRLPLLSLKDEEPLVWTTLNLPPAGDLLVVFFRAPAAKSWESPTARVISDAWDSFYEGDLRILNVSPAPVAAVLGKKRFQVLPGKGVKHPIGTVSELPIQLAWKTARGEWRPFYNTALVQNRSERSHLILYRADGIRPRQPVKALFFREHKPPPPPKPAPSPKP